MLRLIAVAFAAAVSMAAINVSVAATSAGLLELGASSIEPARICWAKTCDRGQCRYRQVSCPRGPAQ